jgi:alpha-glucosidase (family GH31 glycosyl hydrolase)
MKKIALILLVLIEALVFGFQQKVSGQNSVREYQVNSPVARDSSIVKVGKARFTILTSQLVRMEWDSSGLFEDKASLVFLNRNLSVPYFKKEISSHDLTITTNKLQLNYKIDSGKFSPENLSIKFNLNGNEVTWHPGIDDSLNLKGTTRTLDGWFGGSLENLEDGLISRSGWALVDDSRTNLFDGNPDWNWVVERPEESRQDWYFFGYGHEYKKCLKDFTKVAGKIPIPPRYAFGYWWSRYWTYSDSELRNLVNDFNINHIPIDVLIVDMDWHETHGLTWASEKIDEFGQRIGWTGYTWNEALFPDPQKFIQWTNTENLKVALNLHPASGIAPMEEKYSEFAEAFNFDTTDRKNIPFQMENKKFAKTYFNLLLKPFEKLGVDFWWIDWQQWPYTKTIENLSNTWWLNYTFYTNMERNGRRALLFHRWGGLGNHRYQIGFSGDVVVSWQSLTFQPGFTATASNVCYGYWSHDIGGHIPMSIPTDPELYLRWLQYGAFSPILRTHVTKSRISERRIWMFPGYSDLMKSAIELRYALVPYIYNYARKAYDIGISICRPMYYEYPEREIAYQYMNQYYFGDDMIIAPVADPVDKNTNISMKEIWLPEGGWFEWTSGTILEGGKVITRKYALNDIPVFVKAGSIIPMYPKVNNLDSVGDKIILNIIPGISSEIFIYDDDGISDGYKENEFTRIKAAVNYKDDKTLLVSISLIVSHKI